jgi:hypothetical protein
MIDGSRWGGYLIEPITGMVPRNAPAETAAATLLDRAGFARDAVRQVDSGLSYYPSPGGIDEIVTSLFVEIAAPVPRRTLPASLSGFSTAGQLREFDAQDLLRAAHVGVLPEARLEINVYALLEKLGLPPDPFIGEAVDIPDAPAPGSLRRAAIGDLLARPATAPFVPTGTPTRRGRHAGWPSKSSTSFCRASAASTPSLPFRCCATARSWSASRRGCCRCRSATKATPGS